MNRLIEELIVNFHSPTVYAYTNKINSITNISRVEHVTHIFQSSALHARYLPGDSSSLHTLSAARPSNHVVPRAPLAQPAAREASYQRDLSACSVALNALGFG